jgi:GAF domain-containing protein
MADQVANAIQNARFFTQTQTALSETEHLYKITQELLSVNEEEKVYQVAIDAIAASGIDSGAIYMYVDDPTGESVEPIIEQKAIWARSGDPIFPNGTRFKASEMVIEQVVPLHESVLVEDVDKDTRLTKQVRESLKSIRISSVLIIPLSTYQSRLGFMLVAYKTKNKSFSKEQNRYYHTIVQQMVVAVENLRLLAASQRRARREEIIREITGKIRSTTNIDDILKTTVSELGKVVGAPRGGVMLNLNEPVGASTKPKNNNSHQSEKGQS